MEVYLSEHIAPSAYARLARHFEIVDNFDHPERLAAMVIRRAAVPRSVIARAPNLKVIAMHGVSRDTIDTAAAAEFGVPVPNVPGLGAPAVAELAVAELLALNRQLKFVNNTWPCRHGQHRPPRGGYSARGVRCARPVLESAPHGRRMRRVGL